MDGDWDDYEKVSDFDMSESDSEVEDATHDTPSSTPPAHTPRKRSRQTLECPYQQCTKTFNRQSRLTEHIRSHTNTRLFKCPHPPCNRDYLRQSHLKHHIKSAHSDIRDYKCSWKGCEKAFATGTRLRTHIQAHEGREKFRCRGYGDCDQSFRKHETLRRHITAVHEQGKPFTCDDIDSRTDLPCDKAFDTAGKLRQHRRTNHDITKFTCVECMAQNALTEANAEEQTEQHSLPATFSTHAEFQNHLAELHPPTCSYCPTSFRTNKELSRHLELQHEIKKSNSSTNSDEYACTYPDCHKSYSKQGNLNVHVRTTHENRRDFICGITEITVPEEIDTNTEIHGCGRDFTSKASLEEHVRTAHLGLKRKQTLQREKRKAELRESNGDFESKKKNRKDRKIKEIKKKSVIEDLVGVRPSPTIQLKQEVESDDEEENEEDDDNDYLSGSMTMLGSQMYHHTGTWRCFDNDNNRENAISNSDDEITTFPYRQPRSNFRDYEGDIELFGQI